MTYTNKTQPTKISPKVFLEKNFQNNKGIQKEALGLIKIYTKATGYKCIMWNKIFGFGKYYYLDSKGGEHSYLMTGFTISSTGFTLYNIISWEKYKKEITELGKYKISGKSCLKIKNVENINLEVLEKIIKKSITEMKERYKTEK